VTQSASLIGDVWPGDFVALPKLPIDIPGNILSRTQGRSPAAGKTLAGEPGDRIACQKKRSAVRLRRYLPRLPLATRLLSTLIHRLHFCYLERYPDEVGVTKAP